MSEMNRQSPCVPERCSRRITAGVRLPAGDVQRLSTASDDASQYPPAETCGMEVTGGLVAPLVFKTSVGLNKVPGGFDSHSPPIDESGGPYGSPLLFASYCITTK